MAQTNQCFLDDGDNGYIEAFGLARKVLLVSRKNLDIMHPSRQVEQLTLAEALKRPVAVTQAKLVHEDGIFIYNGVCTLSLTAETFHRAGIEAKEEPKSGKYFVQIKLDGSPAHERLIWASENTLTKRLDFEVVGPAVEAVARLGTIKTPNFDCPTGEEAEQDWANTIQEWVGLVAIGSVLLEHNHGVERAVSDYQLDGTPEVLHVAEIEGLLTPEEIAGLWEKATLMLVAGSSHWPVAWGKQHIPSDNSTNPCYMLIRGDTGTIKSLKFVPWQDL